MNRRQNQRHPGRVSSPPRRRPRRGGLRPARPIKPTPRTEGTTPARRIRRNHIGGGQIHAVEPPTTGHGAGFKPAPTRAAHTTAGSIPAPSIAEAEAVGLDPLQLQQVKRAGHRAEIVAFLERHARDGLIEWYSLTPGQPARFAAPARPLAPALQRAIHAALDGFQNFYQHQAGALDAIRAGRNLVIVTPTASGKTLSYNPAVFETLLERPARATCCTSSRSTP